MHESVQGRGCRLRRGYGLLALSIGLLHVAGLALLSVPAIHHPAALGFGGLAYVFGVRHAFDIDHVAVIDNVIRARHYRGERPVFTGFLFSLGHSSVVFALCIGLMAGIAHGSFDTLSRTGAWIGTAASATFLTLLAGLNTGILRDMRRSARTESQSSDAIGRTATPGLFARWLSAGSRRLDAGWKLYAVGLVFGLGFDTATEIALLALSATAAAQTDIARCTLLALPVLFAAGMTLLDSFNGLLMLRAYRWAAHTADRGGFNRWITRLSIATAGLIAGFEWLQLVARWLAPDGALSRWIAAQPTALWGVGVLAVAVLGWLIRAGWPRRRRAVAG